jgi:quercetin dioxygenase-like cupin family protein
MFKKLVVSAIVTCVLAASLAYAQPEAIKRTTLKQVEFPGATHATHLIMVEVLANALVPRHTHPGIEVGYVLEGEADLMIDGQAVLHLKAGERFVIPANAPHSVKNGGKLAKVLSTFVVEKDKPLADGAP